MNGGRVANQAGGRTIYEALLEVELPRGEGPGGSPNEKIKDLLGCTSEEIMSRIYGEGCEVSGCSGSPKPTLRSYCGRMPLPG